MDIYEGADGNFRYSTRQPGYNRNVVLIGTCRSSEPGFPNCSHSLHFVDFFLFFNPWIHIFLNQSFLTITTL